ncbi:hypothetical protein ACOQNP_06095 [Ectopseudomonas khazarica]|uniref:hypothetical protein n=1 Tax=Ectopseudomonas khazarica TaxID=2502979 RepID=UPI003B95633F
MSNKASAAILGVSIIAATATYTVPHWINERSNQNILETTVGGVRLGKVYSESLKAKLIIKNAETGDVFIEVDENADSVYKVAKDRFVGLIKLTNEGKDEKDKITVDTASFKQNMTVTLTIYAAYRSEYQPLYSLTLGEDESTATVGASVNGVLQQAQAQCDKAIQNFRASGQILKLE